MINLNKKSIENVKEIRKNPIKDKLSIQPLIVFEDSKKVGIAFLNYIIRKSRNLNMIVQIKDKRNCRKVLETFLIRVPLGAIQVLYDEISKGGRIRINQKHHKFKVIRYKAEVKSL